MTKNIITLFILLFCISIQALKCNDRISNLTKKEILTAYNLANPSTQIYVQTDKTYYVQNEAIWYKVFITDPTTFQLLPYSDPIIVELLDPQENVVQSSFYLPIGTFSSNIMITNAMVGGIYTIRAYPINMKDKVKEISENKELKDLIFSKKITIQKVITPRILLKLDFLRRAYGKGDHVEAVLKVTDLNNDNVSGANIKASVRLAGKVHDTFTATTTNGEAKISFDLPNDIESIDGILQLIVDDKGVQESITRSIPIVLNNIHLQFFPEGGDIIEGNKNTIAFEAVDEFGKGADIVGELLDDKGNILEKFSSYHLGMGSFSMNAKPNTHYSVRIIKPEGNQTPFPLPKSKKGYGLSLLSKEQNTTYWNIFASSANTNMSLVAHTHGVVQVEKKITLKAGNNPINMDTKDFPMGIAVFTLFDKDIPVAERLIFINSEKKLQIEITPDKESYAPNEKGSISIKTSDSNGQPCSAHIGLSIVDEQLLTMADDKQNTLMSYMLLASELKGDIQEPSFYFDPTEKKATAALDYLLLTHGWRGFEWENVLSRQWENIKKPEFDLDQAIYGFVLNPKGNPVKGAEVFLIQKDKTKKMASVRTNKQGIFMFANVDITIDSHILTSLPNFLFLQDHKDLFVEENQLLVKQSNKIDQDGNTKIAIPQVVEETSEIKNELSPVSPLSEVQTLDEVVTIGYGLSKKNSMTSSVVTVRKEDLTFQNALNGRVPGLILSMNNPINDVSMTFRGQRSPANANMLLLYDHKEYNSLSDFDFFPNHSSYFGYVFTDKNSPMFGSKAINGTIDLYFDRKFTRKTIYPKPKYTSVLVLKKREYNQPKQFNKQYELDNPTVYWNGDIVTDVEGKALVYFMNNNNVSTFRITTEGISQKGELSTQTKRIVTQKPFSIDAKIPTFVGTKDVIKIPLMLKNTTDRNTIAAVSVNCPLLHIMNDKESLKGISVPANSTTIVYIEAKAKEERVDTNVIKIAVTSGGKKEYLEKNIALRNINFPYQQTFSGNKFNDQMIFNYPNTSQVYDFSARFLVHLSILEELTSGVESIIREPSGCFEQVLSSAMPNIFAYQLLNETNSKTSKQIQAILESGYRKLANYEVKGTGGFEWYGGTPAHEMLTAYGLIYFYEMDKISNVVDKGKVQRAEDYLMSRRDGKGGFYQNAGRYGFSGALPQVNNAFIVYAMHYIGKGNLVDLEYNVTKDEALKSKDFYRMALLANVAYMRGDMETYNQLIGLLRETPDLEKANVEGTVVRSYYTKNLEAVSYWLLALLRSDNVEVNLLNECISYIRSKKVSGGFGNTQATSVALQALSKYASLYKTNFEGSIKITINDNQEIIEVKDLLKNPEIKLHEDYFKRGINKITISTLDSLNPVPYELNFNWYSATPEPSKICPLHLVTSISTQKMNVNETVRLSVRLQNKELTPQPMSVAVIGIPAGMSLQPWQLKELLEQNVFDFYEIINDNLVIYYRELGPKEEKIINLDLKAEIPGVYVGQASYAYIYYMSEHKDWIDGIKMDIQEAQ